MLFIFGAWYYNDCCSSGLIKMHKSRWKGIVSWADYIVMLIKLASKIFFKIDLFI